MDNPAAGQRAHDFKRILAHIEANLADSLSLRELAAMAGLSVWRFATVFRQTVGEPPHRFISQLRVRRAQALLRQGMPLASVASAVGFCDQSHLTRRFKHLCCMTPGAYQSGRKQAH